MCQGAPRTCRCIETRHHRVGVLVLTIVREHRAPVGALRRDKQMVICKEKTVREHRAPVGALRPTRATAIRIAFSSQGAPRTCRCIET